MNEQHTTLGHVMNGYGLFTYLWVLALSLAGGAANFFRKLKAGEARPFNLVEFVGELFIAGFTGICTFLFCEAAGFNPLLSAAFIAISGHMGSRALFLFEKVLARRFSESAQ